MAVRKIKASWWIDLQFGKKRYRKRTPAHTRSAALEYEARLRQRLVRGEPLDEGNGEQDVTFGRFAWEWFDEYVLTNNKALEQRAKRYVLSGSLIPFFGQMRLRDISSRHIERFKAAQTKRGATNKTIKNRLTVLNKCLVTAYEWLKLPGSPPKISWPKCVSCRTDYLSGEECERLLTHAEGIIREMILLTLRTGMRQGEVKGLQWNAVDWENQSVAVRHSFRDFGKMLEAPKNNRERYIPLDADVYECLFRRKQTAGFVFTDFGRQPFNGPRMNRGLAQACRKAGIRRVTWHVLRHTFASQLAMKGVPLHVVQTLLGHSSVTTTMRYAHVAPSALRPAIELLNPRRALSARFGQPGVNQWTELQLRDAA